MFFDVLWFNASGSCCQGSEVVYYIARNILRSTKRNGFIFSGEVTASLLEPYQEVQAPADLMDGNEDQLT